MKRINAEGTVQSTINALSYDVTETVKTPILMFLKLGRNDYH